MKNLSRVLVLALAVSGALVSTSCSEKDDLTPGAKAVETASLTVPVTVNDKGTYGKNVDRGTLPVTIDGINVTATSTLFTWTQSTVFTLFPNGTAGNEHSFILDNVAIGNNNITATSTTDATPSLTSEVNPGADPENIMAKLRSNKPYAIYSGTGTANVVQGNPNTNTVSPITLGTTHGRNIAVFKLSNELRQLGVTAVIQGKPTVPGGNVFAFPTMSLKGDAIGDIYWNMGTTGDAKLYFTVTLLDKNNNPLPATSQIPAPSSFGFWLENHAATSTNCIYTISQDALVPATVTELFSAQWIDNDPTTGTIGN